MVVSRVFTKQLYVNHATFGTFTMLFYRAVFSALISLLFLNKDFIYVVYGSIERKNRSGLIMKVVVGMIYSIMIYSSLYFWPMTI